MKKKTIGLKILLFFKLKTQKNTVLLQKATINFPKQRSTNQVSEF